MLKCIDQPDSMYSVDILWATLAHYGSMNFNQCITFAKKPNIGNVLYVKNNKLHVLSFVVFVVAADPELMLLELLFLFHAVITVLVTLALRVYVWLSTLQLRFPVGFWLVIMFLLYVVVRLMFFAAGHVGWFWLCSSGTCSSPSCCS